MRRAMGWLGLSFAACALSAAAPAMAHHSFAMFDRNRTETLTGTVKAFDMINPHSWLQILAVDRSGMNEWSLELGGSGQLAQRGWTSSTFKPGDKITVYFHPSRDGSNGGQFVSVSQLNGQILESRGRGG